MINRMIPRVTRSPIPVSQPMMSRINPRMSMLCLLRPHLHAECAARHPASAVRTLLPPTGRCQTTVSRDEPHESSGGRSRSSPAARSWPLRFAVGVDLVVGAGAVTLDQEPVVFGVEHRRLVVLSGEALDRLQRVPEREHQELGPVVDVAPQHPDAAVAGAAHVPGHAGVLHVAGVGVAVPLADGALPDPGDHGSSSTRRVVRRWPCATVPWRSTGRAMEVVDRLTYVEVGGLRTWHEVHGKGRPVVLLHGGFAGASSWAAQAPVLAPGAVGLHAPVEPLGPVLVVHEDAGQPDPHRRLTVLDGGELFTTTVPFLWHPYLYHYGTTAKVPGEGPYTVRVRIEAPAFMRHDPVNGKRYAESVQVVFEDRRFTPGREPSPDAQPRGPDTTYPGG